MMPISPFHRNTPRTRPTLKIEEEKVIFGLTGRYLECTASFIYLMYIPNRYQIYHFADDYFNLNLEQKHSLASNVPTLAVNNNVRPRLFYFLYIKITFAMLKVVIIKWISSGTQ